MAAKLNWIPVNIDGSSATMKRHWKGVQEGLAGMATEIAKAKKPSKDEVVKVNLFYGKPTFAIAPKPTSGTANTGETF